MARNYATVISVVSIDSDTKELMELEVRFFNASGELEQFRLYSMMDAGRMYYRIRQWVQEGTLNNKV